MEVQMYSDIRHSSTRDRRFLARLLEPLRTRHGKMRRSQTHDTHRAEPVSPALPDGARAFPISVSVSMLAGRGTHSVLHNSSPEPARLEPCGFQGSTGCSQPVSRSDMRTSRSVFNELSRSRRTDCEQPVPPVISTAEPPEGTTLSGPEIRRSFSICIQNVPRFFSNDFHRKS